MDGEERNRLAGQKVIEEVNEGAYGLWWLSFVDPDKAAPPEEQVPGGPGFLGVAIVWAYGPVSAVAKASLLGINPGGEVGMYQLPVIAEAEIPREFIERETLLTQAEAEAL